MVEDLMANYWQSAEFHEGPGVRGTFVEKAKALIDELNAFNSWRWGRRPSANVRLATPTSFTATTTGMSFYDGMVVFEKGRHAPFVSVMRGGRQTSHNLTLEHQRPSAQQVERASASARAAAP
eukprot:5964771-Prymnesium_polylepis.1